MSIDTVIPAEVMTRMQQAAANAATGVRNPAEIRRAREELNRLQDELRRKIGTVDMAVDLIRDARDS